MNSYVKYISKYFLINFLIILTIFVLIIWLTQSLRFIELITAKGVELTTFLKLTSFLVIPMFYVSIPLAILIATVAVLNNLKLHQEIIILKISGLSYLQIFKPFLYIITIVLFFHYLVSLYLMPYSYNKFKNMQNFIKENVISTLFEEGVFNSQTNTITIYVREKESSNIFLGIFIYDYRNPMLSATIIADKGEITFTPKGPIFTLYNGSYHIENKKNNKISLIFFESYKFLFNNEILPNNYKALNVKEKYIWQLFNKTNKNQKEFNSDIVNAVQRIIWPTYNLILPLIVFSLMLTGQYHRKKNWLKILHSCASGSSAIMIFLLFNNLALRDYNLLSAFIISPVICFIIPFTLIYRADHTKKSQRIFYN